MSDKRPSIAEIETELERQRLALNANLTALRDRITPGGIAREAAGLLNTPVPATGVIGPLTNTMRANPLAALAAGTGLVWLLSRSQRTQGGPSALGTAVSAAAALANVVAALEPEEIRAATAEVDRLARASAAKVREIDESLRQTAADVAGSIREGSGQLKDAATEKARAARDAAAQGKARLQAQVDGLAEGAAAAASATRETARRTRQKAKRTADDTYGEVARLVEQNPLAVGAGAAATGALIAALLGASSGRAKGKRQG